MSKYRRSSKVGKALKKLADIEEAEKHLPHAMSASEMFEAVQDMHERGLVSTIFERMMEGTENAPTVADSKIDREWTLQEAAERVNLAPVIRRFGTWSVTDYGVECLIEIYYIPFDRVDEPDWLPHMDQKTWVVLGDFAAALGFARLLNEARRLEPQTSEKED